MAQTEIQLKGWHGVLALIGLGILFLVRIATFGDGLSDESLVKALRKEMVINHYEALTANLPGKIREQGRVDLDEEIADNLMFESIKTSYPFLDFSSPRDVVVKVTFSIRGEYGPGDPITEYYLYRYRTIGFKKWEYRHKTGKLVYYMNFI